MNIQIFGKTKSFATRSAERFFKERKINYQYIDLEIKGLSSRELDSVLSSIKDIDLLFDQKSPLFSQLNIAFIKRTVEDKKEILLLHPTLLSAPIVRECTTKKCTVGDCPTIWKTWA